MIANVISSASRFLSASSCSFSGLKVANSSLRYDLQQIRDRFFWLLLACTLIVAVGVVLESAEDWFPSGKPILDMQKGSFSPSHLTRWRNALVHFGWMLLVVGVIGEGIFEGATSWADGLLQEFGNTMLAITTEQAGNAAKSAKIADDHAGSAVDKSGKANTLASAALGKSNAANDAASEAQKRVEAVGEQADDIDRQLWRTQFLLTARTLRNSDLLIATLRRFNKKKVVLKSFIGDAEGWELCNSLFNAAANAEMDPVNDCGKEYFSPPFLTGILIFGSTKQEIEEFGNIMADAVDPGGAGEMPPEPGSTLTIRVGIKVPYFMDKAHVFKPPKKKQTTKPNTKP